MSRGAIWAEEVNARKEEALEENATDTEGEDEVETSSLESPSEPEKHQKLQRRTHPRDRGDAGEAVLAGNTPFGPIVLPRCRKNVARAGHMNLYDVPYWASGAVDRFFM
ncbi:hypothetical protein NDU88_000078 [Pleurodeles waltl]|uniref:Uncharacterized protein n=1 Tax=Pleurodeles waltl TaxID=8319 RepID=A0AAV7LDL9_PLEWA|nr:hypothetical protein NDU88_000001 [Pleurodeles waltl]KAJ1086799.1 hypothetical protein NDU88_000002 [Pleurodeles waltl]KAJ1086878.1 hypothetical protein NDU88_000078 [Pleurodeles waltl]